MATTSRIKYKKIAKYIFPIFAGFFILLVLSTFITSFLISQRQKLEEKANRDRNSYIESYNLQIVDYSAKLDEVLSLNIKQEPSATYITDLQDVKDLNVTLTKLSNDIYQSSIKINGLDAKELSKDRVRIENHLVYDNLILSLQNYHELIQSHYTVKSCFEEININAKDSVIVENILACERLKAQVSNDQTENRLEEFTKFWDLYFIYWETVKNIHNKPKSSEIPSLKQKLQNDFNAVKKQQNIMENSLHESYIKRYLEQINE